MELERLNFKLDAGCHLFDIILDQVPNEVWIARVRLDFNAREKLGEQRLGVFKPNFCHRLNPGSRYA